MESDIKNALMEFSDIDTINKNIEKNFGSHDIYKVSLAHGYPGIALLFNEAYKTTGDTFYYQYCYSYLNETLNLIKANPMYSTSLFTGIMGYLFTLATCSNEGENYKKVTIQLLQEYENIFNSVCNETYNELYNNVFSKDKLDLIDGVSGNLLSLLHVYDTYGNIHNNLTKWIMKITNLLEILIKKTINNDDCNYENITTDLGLSHGIAGVINVVNASFKRGFGSENLYKTLLKSKKFLLSLIVKYENSYIIPNFKPFSNNTISHRDAWCYGTPGVSIVLYNLGVNLNDAKAIKMSKKLAKETLKRSKDVRLLISPTLCHGYSGIAIINKVLGNHKISNFYFNQIEKSKNDNLAFLFEDLDYNGQHYVYNDNIGLLEGSSGVIMTLLSKKMFNSLWYKLFCFE